MLSIYTNSITHQDFTISTTYHKNAKMKYLITYCSFLEIFTLPLL